MKTLTKILGLVAVGAGVLGLISPDTLLMIGRSAITPAGLYVIAFVRVLVGLLLLLVANASRMPKAVRLLGCLVLIAGIFTPLFGMDRSFAVLNWWAAQGPMVDRLTGVFLVALGAFIFNVIGPVREWRVASR